MENKKMNHLKIKIAFVFEYVKEGALKIRNKFSNKINYELI